MKMQHNENVSDFFLFFFRNENSSELVLDINSLPVALTAAQIVYINADLYKQIQVKEILDLRYQKNKNYSVNKIHEFSNKVRYQFLFFELNFNLSFSFLALFSCFYYYSSI